MVKASTNYNRPRRFFGLTLQKIFNSRSLVLDKAQGHEPALLALMLYQQEQQGCLAKLIVEGVAKKEIAKTLHEIELRIINNELNNVGGFTAKTFENKYQLGLLGSKSSAA